MSTQQGRHLPTTDRLPAARALPAFQSMSERFPSVCPSVRRLWHLILTGQAIVNTPQAECMCSLYGLCLPS